MMTLKRIVSKHGAKLLTLFLIMGGMSYMLISKPKYMGYKPDQPIPFSHKLHARELQVNCKFCHTGVEKSPQAGIPDSATCMKCHEYVAPDSKHIQFLKTSFKKGVPIRWTKVYDLPDHVRFSHKPHIARGLACSTCHGDVANMEKIIMKAPLNMGWCVNCHRHKTAELGLQKSKPGNNATVRLTECGVCHF